MDRSRGRWVRSSRSCSTGSGCRATSAAAATALAASLLVAAPAAQAAPASDSSYSLAQSPTSGSPSGTTTPRPEGSRLGLAPGAVDHDAVEAPELRTRESRTFVTRDALAQTVFSTGSLNYPDAEGRWQPIDSSLVVSARPGYGYQNRANRFTVSFPEDLATTPLRFESGADVVTFALPGAATTKVTTEANSITYHAVADGVDLTYYVAPDGLTEHLTIHSPAAVEAARALRFEVAVSDGLRAEARPTGAIAFLDRAGRSAFSFAPPFMTDAAGAEAGSDRVAYELAPRSGGLALGFAPDEAWLAAPERVYPVVIDPDIELEPNRDCFVSSAARNTSYCSDATLRVGSLNSVRRSLLHFPVEPAIDEQSVVLNAELSLYLTGRENSTAIELSLRGVTSHWTNSATWNDRTATEPWDSPGGDFGGIEDRQDAGGGLDVWKRFYATELVQRWVDQRADNHGVLLRHETTGNIVRFASTDSASAKQPYLTVTHARFAGKMPYWSELDFKLADRISAEVNLASGALGVTEQSFNVAGTGLDLDVGHDYKSLVLSPGPAGFKWATGAGDWMYVREYGDGSASMILNDGARVRFDKQDGEFVTPAGLNAKLTKNPDDSFTLKMHASGERFGFFATGRLEYHEDKNGNRISFERALNDAGEPGGAAILSVTDTQDRVVSFERNSDGLYDAITDPADRSVGLSYTADDILENRTDAAGGVTHHDYNPDGTMSRLTDPDGDQVRFTYDGRDRVTQVIQVTDVVNDTGPTTTFGYPASHADCSNQQRVTKVTDPRGNDTFHCHDHLGRIRKTIDDDGNKTSKTYDANSNLETYEDATLQSTKFSWDVTDRTLTSVELPSENNNQGPKYSFVYDDPEHDFYPSKGIDPQGNEVGYDYNAAGDLIEVKNEVNPSNPFNYGYNTDGTLDFIEDARGNFTNFSYFANGNLQSEDPPGPRPTTSYTYDSLSRVATMTDGKNRTTSYTYDDLDRIESISFEDQSQVLYSYFPDGELATRSDATGTTSFAYDELDRMITKTLPDATVMSFGYDAASNLTSLDDGAGELSYSYDNLNLLDTLTDADSEVTSFVHDENYRRTETRYPNGVTEVTERLKSGRIKSIKGIKNHGGANPETLTSFTYDYSEPGTGADTSLRHKVTDKDGRVTTYDYDKLNRLKDAELRSSSGTLIDDYLYGYDRNSNRTGKTINSSVTSYGYNASNQLCWEVSGASSASCSSPPTGAVTYDHDLNGNLTASSEGFAASYNDA
ncbi:MAG: DNRLRE domain-containing protein, partial [Actinomycetota bacterium]